MHHKNRNKLQIFKQTSLGQLGEFFCFVTEAKLKQKQKKEKTKDRERG